MSNIELLLYGQLGASILMLIGWIIALLIKNTSYVDVLWAYGVGVLGLCFLVIQSDQCHLPVSPCCKESLPLVLR